MRTGKHLVPGIMNRWGVSCRKNNGERGSAPGENHRQLIVKKMYSCKFPASCSTLHIKRRACTHLMLAPAVDTSQGTHALPSPPSEDPKGALVSRGTEGECGSPASLLLPPLLLPAASPHEDSSRDLVLSHQSACQRPPSRQGKRTGITPPPGQEFPY